MEPIVYNESTRSRFRDIIFQQDGGSWEVDRYTYSTQDGHGISSFFGKLFTAAVPLFKSVGKQIILPTAKRAGLAAINKGAEYATQKLLQPRKKRRISKAVRSRKHRARRYV